MLQTYQLYHDEVGTTAGAASIDIRNDGEIVAVEWDLYGLAGAAVTGRAVNELSFGSSTQATINDTTQPISSCSIAFPVSGAAQAQTRFVDLGEGITCNAGERLYVHLTAEGTSPAQLTARCKVYIREKGGPARPPVRRR